MVENLVVTAAVTVQCTMLYCMYTYTDFSTVASLPLQLLRRTLVP